MTRVQLWTPQATEDPCCQNKKGNPIGGAELAMHCNDEKQEHFVKKTSRPPDPEEEQLELGLIVFIAELQKAVNLHLKKCP